jgi:DNA-binding CsgD family transcriptional regulator/tetratricopeptide (TPR) repeat protein
MVLAGRATEGSVPMPFRPLAEALLAAFRAGEPPQLGGLRPFRGTLGRLVPEWRAEGVEVADESLVVLGEALVRLLGGLAADRGCVLVVEDMHWADPETLAVIEYLGDNVGSERVLCVATMRPQDGSANGLLAPGGGRRQLGLLELSPLSEIDIGRMAAACLGSAFAPPEVARFLAARSDGLPFLVEELLAGLMACGALVRKGDGWEAISRLTPAVPLSLAETVRQRLGELTASGRRAVEAAAVLGRRFEWPMVPAVADLDGAAVLEALRQAIDFQLIEVDGDGFRFRHALSRDAVLAEMLPPMRVEAAHRALAAVTLAHPGFPGAWCGLAADLAEQAGEHDRAAGLLVELAKRALGRGAMASAEAILDHAWILAPPDSVVGEDVREVLVTTLSLAGKPDRAIEIGAPLLHRLSSAGEPSVRLTELSLALARSCLAAGDPDAAANYVESALGRRPESADPALIGRVEAVAAHVALEADRLAEAESRALTALQTATVVNQPAVECEALEVLGRVTRERDLSEAVALFRRSAEVAERAGLSVWHLRARHELAIIDAVSGRYDAIIETRRLAEESGAFTTVAVMDLYIADFALFELDCDRAAEYAARCIEASRRFGLSTLQPALLALASSEALAGRGNKMEATLSEALAPTPDDPRLVADAWGKVRAFLAMTDEDRAGLRRAADASIEYVRRAPSGRSVFPGRVFWVLLHTMEDDDFGAAARAEYAASSVVRLPFFAAVLASAEAVALGRAGQADEADTQFKSANALLADRPKVHGLQQYVRRLVAEAAIRDGWGEPQSWLREVEAFFSDRNYPKVAGACRSLLRQTGAKLPRKGRGDSMVPAGLRAFGVTSRECDVLRQLGEGLSNREIGERLFLSPRTVEHHVASLMARTGAADRIALATFASHFEL